MKKLLVLLSASFFVIGFVLFGNTLHNYFVSDDFVWLLQAKRDVVSSLPGYLIDSQGFFYRPFTKFYFFWMWRTFGTDAYGYHVISLILHVLNSVLVFVLSYKLLTLINTKNLQRIKLISVVSALLFLVHPVHQENIIWISAVTELFPAFFIFSALSIYLYSGRFKNGSLLWQILFYIGFILALFSHEYAVIFPVLIFLVDYFIFQTNVRDIIRSRTLLYIKLVSIDLLYLLLRSQANSHWSGGDYSYNLVKLPFNLLGNLLGYGGLSLIGIPFISLYQNLRFALRANLSLSALLVVVFIVGGYFVYRIAKKNNPDSIVSDSTRRIVLFLSAFYIVGLLPFLGLGGIAERYLYLPSFAGFLLLSLFLYWIIRYFDVPVQSHRSWYLGIVFLVIVLYSISLKQDQQDWKIASSFVYNRLTEFRISCDQFQEGQSLARVSPPNRQGRAWVFQVGYEQGANLLCDKKLTIVLK